MMLTEVHARNAFISQAKIRDSVPSASTWLKRDFLFRPWTIEHIRAVETLKHSGKKGLVVSNSDYPFGSYHSALLPLLTSIKRLAVTNLSIQENANLMTFPIGITDPMKGSVRHELFSRTEQLTEAFSYSSHKVSRVSISFSTNTHRSRRYAMRHALRSSFCEVISPDFSPEGRQNALNHSATSLGVACPRGNGLDTHRLWETLYVGSIPVVVENEFPRSLLEGSKLPYVSLRDWSELNSKSTIEKLERASQGKFQFESLTCDYWLNRLQSFFSQDTGAH